MPFVLLLFLFVVLLLLLFVVFLSGSLSSQTHTVPSFNNGEMRYFGTASVLFCSIFILRTAESEPTGHVFSGEENNYFHLLLET